MSRAAEAPAGIDVPQVERFFARHVPGGEPPLTFELIGGGRSNITYLVRAGDEGPQSFVLRRPPLGHVLPTAHDMTREYRVLVALAQTEVPAPHPLALCEDESVNGAPFYVMTYTPGVVLHEGLPAGFAAAPAERQRMADALIDTLVGLHAVDYEAVGLGDFGRPAGYLERQARRWTQQWERSKTRELPAIEEVLRLLAEKRPESPAPTIVHGDYRFGNLALDAQDPGRVVAIFDWEMSTIGDPLSDLGYALMYWGEASDPPEGRQAGTGRELTTQPGFPTRAQVAERYARCSGRDIGALAFYEAFAYAKLAVISEGINARFLQGKTVGEGFGYAAEQTERLATRALELASGL